MLKLSVINNLGINNLKFLEAEDLVFSKCLNNLEQLSNDPYFDLEPGKALEFYEILAELVNKYETEISQNTEAYLKLSQILIYLTWKASSAMPIKVRQNILSDHLVTALSIGVSVKNYLEKILAPYEFIVGPEKEMRRQWVYSLENNKEQLGKKPISFSDGESLSPTVQNWLKLYNSRQNKGGANNFSRINFLNTDPNISVLEKDEKMVLQEIFNIYNWLLSSPPEPKVIPDEEFKTKNYLTTKKNILPEGFIENKKEEVLNEIQSPTKKIDIQDILNRGSGIRLGRSKVDNVSSVKPLSEQRKIIPPAPPRPKGEQREPDLDEIRQEIENKKQMAQGHIDKKLENLKKRSMN